MVCGYTGLENDLLSNIVVADGQIGQLYELMQALQKRGKGMADEEMDEALNVTLDEGTGGKNES